MKSQQPSKIRGLGPIHALGTGLLALCALSHSAAGFDGGTAAETILHLQVQMEGTRRRRDFLVTVLICGFNCWKVFCFPWFCCILWFVIVATSKNGEYWNPVEPMRSYSSFVALEGLALCLGETNVDSEDDINVSIIVNGSCCCLRWLFIFHY